MLMKSVISVYSRIVKRTIAKIKKNFILLIFSICLSDIIVVGA